MADVNDMFNDITKEQSYYKPKAKKDLIPYAEGDYLCHIVEVKTKMLDVRGKYKAELYSFTVEVAEENKDKDFMYEDINGDKKATKGTPYVGKRFFGKLWRFIEPKEGDTFESNSENNVAYLRFCQALGLTIETTRREVNGKTLDVQILPTLTESDIDGRPVIAAVGRDKDWINDDGETMPSFKVKFVKLWKEGKLLATTTTNDLPF